MTKTQPQIDIDTCLKELEILRQHIYGTREPGQVREREWQKIKRALEKAEKLTEKAREQFNKDEKKRKEKENEMRKQKEKEKKKN